MITIDDISFEHATLYSERGPAYTNMSSVKVRYSVHLNRNKVDGELSIEPDEYGEMIYRDVLDKIRKHFNETVDNI